MSPIKIASARWRTALLDIPPQRIFWALLALHVLTWWLYGRFALVGAIHDDMAEAWVWGQELQLGYHKHPPLFAWVTWAWFQVAPRTGSSFYLLASLNAGLGLAGAWALAGQFLTGHARLASMLLLLLTPIYGILALKFNANSVLLPIWPWMTYFFVRTLRDGGTRNAVALGVLAGLGMLGKYYTAVLLAAFLIAALLDAQGRRRLLTPSPYLAAITGMAVMAPHVWWAMNNHFETLAYAGSKFSYPLLQIWSWAGVTALAPIAFGCVAALVLVHATGVAPGDLRARMRLWLADRRNWWLAALAALPFLITLAFGFLGHAKVSISYTIPIFYLAPVLVVMALGARVTPVACRGLATAAAAVMAFVLVASPVIGYARTRLDVTAAVEPRREIAKLATRLWHKEMAAPLTIVAGTNRYAGSLPFYSGDRPSHFIDFDEGRAPWVTPRRLSRSGLLVICLENDQSCKQAALQYETSGTIRYDVTLRRNALGHAGPAQTFTLRFVPPQPAGAAPPPADETKTPPVVASAKASSRITRLVRSTKHL